MNAITQGTESCDFATVDDLLACALVRRFTSDAAFTHLAYGGRFVLAYTSGMCCVVGMLKEPVRMPKEIARPGQT